LNRSSRTIKTFYEDCEEKLEDIKKNHKGIEVELDLDKQSQNAEKSNEESNKTRDGRSAKKKVSFIRLENDISRNSCCSTNGSCSIF
jgi:hypothetical protein